MRDLLLNGTASADYAALLARIALGGFYVLARFRYFYDPSRPDAALNRARREGLARKVEYCGYCPAFAPVVAGVEVLAGLGVLFGALTLLSALGLLIVTLFATCCTAREKVYAQHPVDGADVVCAYLWRVEGLYIVLAAIVLALGPGAFSIDALVASWLF